MPTPVKKKERNQAITMDRYMVRACEVLHAHYRTNDELSISPKLVGNRPLYMSFLI